MRAILLNQTIALPEGITITASIEATLPIASWQGKTQTITNAQLLSADNYNYIVGPDTAEDNYLEYTSAGVRAEEVPDDGHMVFRCNEVPKKELTVEILRLEAKHG